MILEDKNRTHINNLKKTEKGHKFRTEDPSYY